MYYSESLTKTMDYNQNSSICFASMENLNFYRIENIAYLCAHQDYSLIVLKDGRIEQVERTIEQLKDRLRSYGFVQVFNIYLVNRRYLKPCIEISDGRLKMNNGDEIGISANIKYKYRLSDVLEY